MSTLKRVHHTILISSTIGLLLSLYAYKIEISLESNNNKNYKALCDINEYMSCSKVFMSKYGKGFGILGNVVDEKSILFQPNPVYGLVFYSLLILLNQFNNESTTKLLVYLAVLSNILSIYLAFILYLLRDICIVCVGIYIVNLIILIFAQIKFRRIKYIKNVEKNK